MKVDLFWCTYVIVPIEDDLYLPLFVLYIVNTNWVNLIPTLYSAWGQEWQLLCISHIKECGLAC